APPIRSFLRSALAGRRPDGRPVQQVAHHLDEPVLGHGRHHRGGVVLGHGEEEGLLVAEMVKDRAAGQPDLLLEAAYGRTLVPVPRKARPRTGEDLLPARFELVLAHPRHRSSLTGAPARCNPYVRLAASTRTLQRSSGRTASAWADQQ